MGDVLSGVGVLPTSAGALLALFCVLVLTGKVPTLRELRDAQERAAKWESIAVEWQAVATKLGMSVERLLVLAETSNHALVEIQAALHRHGEQEDPR